MSGLQVKLIKFHTISQKPCEFILCTGLAAYGIQPVSRKKARANFGDRPPMLLTSETMQSVGCNRSAQVAHGFHSAILATELSKSMDGLPMEYGR